MTSPERALNPNDEGCTEKQGVEAARRYVEQLHAFYIHACVFTAGMVIIFVVNLATNISAGIARDWRAWWSVWAFAGWGIGVAVHGLVVRLNRPSPSSPTWEQRQIDKVLSR